MPTEVQAAEVALFETLTGDASVGALVSARVFPSLAPQQDPTNLGAPVPFPYVLFHRQGGRDRNTGGSDRRVFCRLVYSVRAVTEGDDYSDADAVDAAVDAALLGLEETVTLEGVQFLVQCVGREEPLRQVQQEQGRRINLVGGLYRLFVQRL